MKDSINQWELFVDGASRNNPGLSGIGMYLIKNGKPLLKDSFFIGVKTNNEAEYYALLLGISYAKDLMHSSDRLIIFSDSELVVRQIKGIYKVRKMELKKIYLKVLSLLRDINYSIRHVDRAENSVADALANEGIDKKKPIPKRFLDYFS